MMSKQNTLTMKSSMEVPITVEPFESQHDPVFVSKLLTDGSPSKRSKSNSNLLSLLDDDEKAQHTYFASKTKLNEAAMIEYEL